MSKRRQITVRRAAAVVQLIKPGVLNVADKYIRATYVWSQMIQQQQARCH